MSGFEFHPIVNLFSIIIHEEFQQFCVNMSLDGALSPTHEFYDNINISSEKDPQHQKLNPEGGE
jgi:hypothetical protein